MRDRMNFRLLVSGKQAHFSNRDIMGGVRKTYPVLTPSAAQGLLEAIGRETGMAYTVEQIDILHPVKYGVMETESLPTISMNTVMKQIMAGKSVEGEGVTRREKKEVLLDVEYVIHGYIEVKADRKSILRALDRMRSGRYAICPVLGDPACPVVSFRLLEASETYETAKVSMEVGPLPVANQRDGMRARTMIHARIVDGVMDCRENQLAFGRHESGHTMCRAALTYK